MTFFPVIKKGIDKMLDIPSTDPDDSRRRKLLNVILLIMGILSVITFLITFIIVSRESFKDSDNNAVAIISTISLISIASLFYINRKIQGGLAAGILLIGLIILLSFSDAPNELISGRSLLFFTIPIVVSSMVLRPAYSFLTAIVVTINMYAISWFGLQGKIPPNPIGIIGFFLLASIAWLSSRTVDNALGDLRLINAELDKRVAERTKELSESLKRESAQASQRQAILQGIADGVLVFDNYGNTLLSNPAVTQLLNKNADEIKNKSLEEILIESELADADRLILQHTIATQDANLPAIRVRWGKRTISVSAAPVHDLSTGSLIGNVAVLRDFTREAELEEMKNTFVAMVSHELRTPLNAILGYSEMLKEGHYGGLNEMQQKTASRILKNSQRLLDIVSDLLTKAQIEAGTLKIKMRPFTPTELDEGLHSVMDKLAADKNLYLTSKIDPTLPELLNGDPQRLQQVLVNLVNNAVKFTSSGGIHIQMYLVSPDFWAIDVQDTGPGISLEDQRLIFEPFRQLEGIVTRQHSGIGLGLSIVKKLVDLMQGKIFLKSTIGKGSTFTIILPVNQQESV